MLYLKDRQVAERYGVDRSTVWRWVRSEPTFPKAFKLSNGCARWRLADLEAWEAARSEVSA